jgi:hypothetical protein
MRKMKTKLLFLAAMTAILLTSCQKEVSLQDDGGTITPNNNILGKWNFLGLNAKTNSSISYTEMGFALKAVALSDYDTENNAGTLEVTADKFFFKGIGHTIDDEAEVLTYVDGLLLDQTVEPFNVTTPPTDDTFDYVRNNNDSLTFPNARAMLPDISGGSIPAPAGPIGARISILSDTLVLVTKSSIQNTVVQAGVPTTYFAEFISTMKFKRQ